MFLYIKIDMYWVLLKRSMYYLSTPCLVILKDRQTAVHKHMHYNLRNLEIIKKTRVKYAKHLHLIQSYSLVTIYINLWLNFFP